jgi:hypothetical protein
MSCTEFVIEGAGAVASAVNITNTVEGAFHVVDSDAI